MSKVDDNNNTNKNDTSDSWENFHAGLMKLLMQHKECVGCTERTQKFGEICQFCTSYVSMSSEVKSFKALESKLQEAKIPRYVSSQCDRKDVSIAMLARNISLQDFQLYNFVLRDNSKMSYEIWFIVNASESYVLKDMKYLSIMDLQKNTEKLEFAGCRTLSDEQLQQHLQSDSFISLFDTSIPRFQFTSDNAKNVKNAETCKNK